MDLKTRYFGCILVLVSMCLLSRGVEACTTSGMLPQKINAILQNHFADLDRTTPGIYVQQWNKTSKQWADLFTLRHHEYHSPASNNKVLTTAAIISALGPHARIETPVFGTGQAPAEPILCIRGMGDPSMRYNALQAAVQDLSSQGVKNIDKLILDDTLYSPAFPEGWQWGDLPYYYGAQPTPFILNENVVSFSVAPASTQNQPLQVVAYSEPADASMNLVDTSLSQTASSNSPLNADVAWRLASDKIFVVGQAPIGHSSVSMQAAVPKPTARFAHWISKALKDGGISLNKPPVAGSCFDTPSLRPRFTIKSDTLGNMVNNTLQVSDNLMAEIWSRYLGYITKSPGDATDAGIAAVSAQLSSLGIDPTSFHQRDGSGLNGYNLVSPAALVNTFKAMAQTPYAAEYKSYLPNSFPGGKLYYRFTGTPAVGRVFAKTGYISLVSSLSGWVDSDKLFSIMLDQSHTPGSIRNTIINEIVLAVADLCPLH